MSQDETNTTTASATYLQLISKDEKAVQKDNLKIKAQEASLNVSREILALNAEVSMLKTSKEAAQRAIPYSVGTEYAISKKLAEAEARLEFATEVRETRFTDANI